MLNACNVHSQCAPRVCNASSADADANDDDAVWWPFQGLVAKGGHSHSCYVGVYIHTQTIHMHTFGGEAKCVAPRTTTTKCVAKCAESIGDKSK